MNLINPKLTLFFEIRKSNQCQTEDFCEELVEIANLYLTAISFPLTYTSQDLTLERLEQSPAQLPQISQQSPSSNQGFILFTPGAGLKIEHCFTFLCRTLRCHLYKRHDEEGSECPSLKQSAVQLQELKHFGEYPIRNLRVESLHRHSIAPELQVEPEVELATDRGLCCCCDIS